MNEMIERVAKAIAAEDGYDSWEDAHERTLLHYSSFARAAIEAMREPTRNMVYAAINCDGPPSINWMAMIDEALK